MLRKFLALLTVLMLGTAAAAQTTTAPAGYGGSWLESSKMTGDWGGVRSALADKGITLDIDYTQVLQGNAHGGRDTNNAFRASGSNDIEITLDFGKMGLWQGGNLLIHGESVWGGGIDKKVGALLPTNLNAALPGSAEPGFGLNEGGRFLLSEIIFTQVLLDGKLILLGGKLWGARAFDTNMFANDEETQFMNAGLRNNMLIPPFLPYTNWGAGFIVNPTEWLSILTAVADTQGRAKTTGFETTFHGDTNDTVIHEWSFKVKPFGLDGHQRVGFATSCMDFPKVSSPPGGPPKTADSNCMIYYNFDQYLWTESEDSTQGVGVFGRFGWARQDVNAASHFYSLGVGGKGIIPTRDKDTFGLGYYFMDLSNDLPPMMHSEQAIECFYNIQITPWLHISPDLQVVINPGGSDAHDVALVYGLRMHFDL